MLLQPLGSACLGDEIPHPAIHLEFYLGIGYLDTVDLRLVQ